MDMNITATLKANKEMTDGIAQGHGGVMILLVLDLGTGVGVMFLP
jgi:hypothetical protein